MNIFAFLLKKQEIRNKSKEISQRFPLAIIISSITTLLFCSIIAFELSHDTSEIIGKVIMSAIVTFFLSLWVTLLWESLKNKTVQSFGQIWALLFGGIFYSFLTQDIESITGVTFFILTLFGTISVIFSSPYIKYLYKWTYSEISYFVYFYRISLVFFMSLIVGSALALLWNIAIGAVIVLFDLWYSSLWDIHAYWTIFALCFLTPLFMLTEVPKKDTFEESRFSENIFFSFLIKYIAIPFIYIYFFILYAYTLKVLLNFSHWPRGEVSWMVIWFSLFWYIIYMFSYIFQSEKSGESNKLIGLFRKYFPYIVIPQIAMLSYAIALRIGQYDLTINRYFVVVFGLWLLTVSLYLIISKAKSLLYIPAFLTLFTLIVSIGPWSVYQLPLERQTSRLINNLELANIIEWNTIVPLENYSDIPKELSNDIYDGIDYICDFNNCNKIQEIFPLLYDELYKKSESEYNSPIEIDNYIKHTAIKKLPYRWPSKWQIIDYITDKIQVKRTYSYGKQDDEIYRMYNNSWYFPLEITGYDYVLETNSYNNTHSNITAKIDNTTLNMTLTTWELQENISIAFIFDALRQSYSKNNDSDLSAHNNEFEIETVTYMGKFIVNNANIFSRADYNPLDAYSSESISGILLLKKK